MASFATPRASFSGERLILVGTYGQDLGFVKGAGEGVYAFKLGGTGLLSPAVFLNAPLLPAAAVGLNSSYLCAHPTKPGVVYVTDERCDLERGGRVSAARVVCALGAAPTAEILSAPAVAADTSTCHLVAQERHLYAANYCGGGGSERGSCAAFPLDPSSGGLLLPRGDPAFVAPLPPPGAPDGSAERVAFPRAGAGVVLERQDTGHCHMTLLAGDGSAILCPDLGSDIVYRMGTHQLLDARVACACAPGDGPRHAAWHPTRDVLYVLCELSCRLLAFKVDRATGLPLEGDTAPFAAARTLPGECYPAETGNAPPNSPACTCAALRVHPSGKFLYCAARRPSFLSLFGKRRQKKHP